MTSAASLIQDADRVLVLGIGGGGDVVGSLAVARFCESLGADFVLGGVAWERFAIDPHPGPRGLDEVRGGRRIGPTALIADDATTTPEGIRFAESGMAEHLGAPTVLIDVTAGRAVRPTASRPPRRSSPATSPCTSTSAATCWGTATRTAWRARCATR